VTFVSRKIATVVLGILAMPAILAVAALVFLVLAVLICPGVRDMPTADCKDCNSIWCPIVLAALIFVALPLALLSLYISARRKGRHRDAPN
jgi:H+/Cl- antiporter ClcA